MKLNWHEIDRFLTGEAWSGSLIRKHTTELADVIGPRWGGSSQDRMTAEYISNQMKTAGLDRSEIEPFEIDTWNHGSVSSSQTLSQILSYNVIGGKMPHQANFTESTTGD